MAIHRSLFSQLIPAIVLAVCGIAGVAQDHPADRKIPDRPDYPTPDRDQNATTPAQREAARRLWRGAPPQPAEPSARIRTHTFGDPGDARERATGKIQLNGGTAPSWEWEALRARPITTAPDVSFLDWAETPAALPGPRGWTATRTQNGKVVSLALDVNDVAAMLSSGATIVNSGSIPRGRAWRELTEKYPSQIITHEPESVNRDPRAIAEAMALGDRPLNPVMVRVFNALPQETTKEEFFMEQSRMNLGGTREAWRDLNERVRAASGGLPMEVARKSALLNELKYGTNHVVIVYAHFYDGRLYMPGATGDSVSIEEIAEIERAGEAAVHDRVIVLASCNGAARQDESRSLTSVLLEKGIARTVLAIDRPYDAEEIPGLLTRIANGQPLRKAAGNLRQHVEVRLPDRLMWKAETRAASEG